jgi:filamentous hemagglutinin
VASSGPVPAFALDVAALGGMYAGKIFLVGTEAGLGVRNAGVIGATAGDVVLTNDGWLTNSGSLYASVDTTLNATGAVTNSGTIAAQGSTAIAAQTLHSGLASLLAAGLKSDGGLSLTPGNSLQVTTAGETIAVGENLASHKLVIEAASVDLSQSRTRAAQITISASNGDISTTGASVTTPGNLRMQAQAGTLNNSLGILHAGGDLQLELGRDFSNSAQVIANQNLALRIQGNLVNTSQLESGATLTVQARQISNAASAEIQGKAVLLEASDTVTNRGLINSASADGGSITRIDALGLSNIGTGRIFGDTVAIGTDTLNNAVETLAGQTRSGTIAARNRLAIGTGTLSNTGGAQILSLGDMSIGGALDSNAHATGSATRILNEASTIEATEAMQMATATLQNMRPNVHITQVVTADETVSMGKPSYWGGSTFGGHYQNIYYDGYDNYYLNPSAILRHLPDVYSADGFLYHRVEVQLSTNDSVFVQSWSASDDQGSYAYDRKAVAAGSKVLYYTSKDDNAKNPDFFPETIPGGGGVTMAHMASADPTNFGKCQSDCIHIVTAQDYNNLNQFMSYDGAVGDYIRYGERAGDWEGTRVAHHVTTTDTLNANAGAAGVIRSGRSMAIDASTVLDNHYSSITAGGALQINGQSKLADASNMPAVHNVGQLLYSTDTFTNTSYARNGYSKGEWSRPSASQVVGDLKGTIAGDQVVSIQGNINNIDSGKTPANVGTNGQSGNGGLAGLTLPSSLFKTSTPDSRYVVETDSRFSNYKTWLSSDYISTKLALDPSVTQKRLGDGFYEQQLVREQVAALTGRRFLGNYQNDQDQYQALMDAGIAYAQQTQLRPGIALSAEQMAQLTGPLVWLVEETLKMPDGSAQKVLSPRVYASKNISLQASGALLMGDSVALNQSANSTAVVVNQGLVQATQALDVRANTILNQGGSLRARDVRLAATQDVVNVGGKVQAQNSLSVQAGRDIVAQTTSATEHSGGLAAQDLHQTTVQQVARFEVGTSAAANSGMTLQAGRDISLNAAQLANAGSGATSLAAQRNVNLGSVATSSALGSVQDAQNYTRSSQSSEVGTRIQSAGKLAIAAGNDINARAATLQSGQDTTLSAGNNVVLQAGQATTTLDSQRHSSESDGISSKTSDTQTQASSASAQASTLSGNNVSVQAGNNLASVGSRFNAQETIDVGGANQTLLYATQDVSQSSTTTQSSSSMLGISLESKTTSDSKAQATAVATQLIATERVQIGVGSKTELRGTEVEAPLIAFTKTDPSKAGELLLNASTNTTQSSHTEKSETLGLYQEAKGQGSTVQTLNQTSLKGNVTFDAGLKITAQIPKDVQQTAGGQALAAQVQTLSSTLGTSQTGLNYLNQLAANPNVKWDQVALANERWSYDQAGLTPAGAALLSIAIAAYTGGMGAELLGVSNATAAAAMNAGFSSLAAQASVAMVNNGGDIGKTLQQLGSEESIKGLLTTMATAGALQSLDKALGFDSTSAAYPSTFLAF